MICASLGIDWNDKDTLPQGINASLWLKKGNCNSKTGPIQLQTVILLHHLIDHGVIYLATGLKPNLFPIHSQSTSIE